MSLTNPWPDGYTINTRSPYGWRVHPITGKRKFHRGVDVAGSFPVTAAGDGVVSKVSYSPNKSTGGGHVVIIKHADRLFTVYYHGAHAPALKVGQRVKTGDFIYTAGSTGASTGNHLHFEVRTGSQGQWGTDTDPVPYLNGAVSPSQPLSIPVNGRLDKTTWKALQGVLGAKGFEPGIPDGKPGVRTYSALQRWAGIAVTGTFDTTTKKAVQGKLGVVADGNWGRLTISALQRAINAGEI